MNTILRISSFIAVFSLTECSAQTDKLFGTKWEYAFDSESKDYIEFLGNNKFKSYSAESMMTSIGVYFVQNDTLNLVNVIDVDDDHRFSPSHYKAVIKNDILRYVTFDRIYRGEWKTSDFKFDPSYYLTKVK